MDEARSRESDAGQIQRFRLAPEGYVTCAFGNDARPYADLTDLGY